MKLKKFMLSALILVFAVGCVNHSGQSASGFDETYYPSVYDELLELDRIDRVEGFILGRDPDYDEKKINKSVSCNSNGNDNACRMR